MAQIRHFDGVLLRVILYSFHQSRFRPAAGAVRRFVDVSSGDELHGDESSVRSVHVVE